MPFRLLTVLVLCVLTAACSNLQPVIGTYYRSHPRDTMVSQRITLCADSTYRCEVRGDLMHAHESGAWVVSSGGTLRLTAHRDSCSSITVKEEQYGDVDSLYLHGIDQRGLAIGLAHIVLFAEDSVHRVTLDPDGSQAIARVRPDSIHVHYLSTTPYSYVVQDAGQNMYRLVIDTDCREDASLVEPLLDFKRRTLRTEDGMVYKLVDSEP